MTAYVAGGACSVGGDGCAGGANGACGAGNARSVGRAGGGDDGACGAGNDGRYAAIDIGTVTCRMLVADVRAGRVVPLAKEYAITNLGEGVDAMGELLPAAMQRVAETIDRYLVVRDSFDTAENPLRGTLVMATSASRDAKNADEFAALLAERGIELAVIPGEREAALSFLGATQPYAGLSEADNSAPHNLRGIPSEGKFSTSYNPSVIPSAAKFSTQYDPSVILSEAKDPALQGVQGSPAALGPASAQTVAVVDIGGGSTEVVAGAAGQEPAAVHSFNIGCRRVTERFLASDPPAAAEIAAARAWMREQFEAKFAELFAGLAIDQMVAVAGTATSVVSIREAMEVYDSERVHGSVVTLADVQAVGERLASLPLEKRRRVVGLDPGRAPVIVAGMIILEEVMRALGVDAFAASESDILDGMILELARR